MLDNYDMWASHDAEQEDKLNKLPRCSECGEPIQDDYAYYIDGKWICEECMSEFKRVVA